MNLDDVKKIKVKRAKKHRVGRGPGSGWGTTAGRGNKGAGQRSGTKFRLRFEGGQMPLYRRLPKKGFTNARFKVAMHAVNVGDLAQVFEAGATVDLDALKRVGLAPKRAKYLKVLGFGDLDKALVIVANGISAGAREKVEAAKGTITLESATTIMRDKFVSKRGVVSTAGGATKAAPKAAAPKAAPAEAPRADEPAADEPAADAPDDTPSSDSEA